MKVISRQGPDSSSFAVMPTAWRLSIMPSTSPSRIGEAVATAARKGMSARAFILNMLDATINERLSRGPMGLGISGK